ncbi:MAG: hydrolase [Candidatus Dojkabacteria bacterium]|nr:MAG: hydrolase [Candidatus Dojkabacteria bacterium]
MRETVFTKIVKGEIPCFKLGENENAFAFLDINPVTEGHSLVVPKYPYRNIFDTPENILGDVIVLAKEVAILLKDKLGADGINIVSSNGREANQEIEHLHFHVVPRYKKESLNIWQELRKYQVTETIEDVYKKIKS